MASDYPVSVPQENVTTMSAETAHTLHDVLVAHPGAPERCRGDFVASHRRDYPVDHRCRGFLGFDDKFRRNRCSTDPLPDAPRATHEGPLS